MGSKRFFFLVAPLAAFSGILFGYDTGVISGAILFISEEFALSPQENGFVVASVLLGAILGSILSGRFSDAFGRKNLLIADSLIFMLATLLTSLAWSTTILVVGRVIVGVAIGVASYTTPLYLSEISPAKYRGALVSLNQLAIVMGMLLSYIVDYFLADTGSWRWMLGLGVVPAVFLFCGLLFLPYSPRWLAYKGREKEAFEVLSQLRTDLSEVRLEMGQILGNISEKKGSWQLLFSRTTRPALLIAMGLAIIQQVTGINTILYYAPTIFTMAGFTDATSAIFATMGVGAFFVVTTAIVLPLIDILGRKPLLYAGITIMALSLGYMSWAFYQESQTGNLGWIILCCMLVYIGGFAISLGPIMWLMISEVFPLRVRGLGSSLATCTNWSSNFIVTLTFLTLLENFGPSSTFFIYSMLSLLSLGFVYKYVPETKGVSLEQIEANLYAGKPARLLGI